MLRLIYLVKSNDESKYMYSGYEIVLDRADSRRFYYDFVRVVVIFGVDNSLSFHSNEKILAKEKELSDIKSDRYLKGGVCKSVVHVIKHANILLYSAYSESLIWKNWQLATIISTNEFLFLCINKVRLKRNVLRRKNINCDVALWIRRSSNFYERTRNSC